MSKKKALVKKQAKQVQAATTPAEPKKGGNEAIALAIVIAILVFLSVEIFVVIKKREVLNKKPVFVTEWSPVYKGHLGWSLYGDHLYIIDINMNQVKKYTKMDGRQLEVYETKDTPLWAVETLSGETIIAVRNSNVLTKYMGVKQTGIIELKEVKNLGHILLNSKDELYIVDIGTNEILKYDLNGVLQKKLNVKFSSIGKMFRDKNDWLYVFENANNMGIKIIDNRENFVREFRLKSPIMRELEAMAITNDGNIYINDFSGGMIHVYSSKGKLLSKWNTDKDFKYKIGLPGVLCGGFDDYVYVGSRSFAVFQPIKYK